MQFDGLFYLDVVLPCQIAALAGLLLVSLWLGEPVAIWCVGILLFTCTILHAADAIKVHRDIQDLTDH